MFYQHVTSYFKLLATIFARIGARKEIVLVKTPLPICFLIIFSFLFSEFDLLAIYSISFWCGFKILFSLHVWYLLKHKQFLLYKILNISSQSKFLALELRFSYKNKSWCFPNFLVIWSRFDVSLIFFDFFSFYTV